MTNRVSIAIILGCLALLTACLAESATIQVPADFPTIQQAMNSAASGDTVLVSPGRYVENINFKTKNLVVAGRYLLNKDPNDILATVIDGSSPTHPDTGSCVRIVGNQNSSTVLMGFTLTGGAGTRWLDISDFSYYREGGGILIENSAPIIANNYIILNSATNKTNCRSAGGGAIRAGFGSGAVFTGNIIAFNGGFYGGGVVIFHYAAEFKNNVFWNNTGGNEFGGAGLWIWNSSTEGTTLIENNTFVANTSVLGGGGLDVANSVVNLTNNIFWGNSGSPGPQIHVGSGVAATITYCDIQGGGFSGQSNTDEFPFFAPSDLMLSPGSPCVDSGDPASQYNDREDLGNPGMALAPSLGTIRNDRGAFGGQGAFVPFSFTSTMLDLLTDSVDFGPVHLDSSKVIDFILAKGGYGWVRIDSVKFSLTTGTSLECVSSLPRIIPLPPGNDTLQLKWQPTVKGSFRDTALIYHRDTTFVNPIRMPLKGAALGCCFDKTGNVNNSGIVDLADLSALVSYLTGGGYVLPCPEAANVNAVGIVDLADLSALVSYLTGGGYILPACA